MLLIAFCTVFMEYSSSIESLLYYERNGSNWNEIALLVKKGCVRAASNVFADPCTT